MDTQTQLAGLLGAVVGLVGLALATSLEEHVDGVIRATTVGTFVGTAVAYRRRLRRPDADPFTTITRWSYVGFAAGLLLAAQEGLA
jgi:hypothetical protein